MTDAHPANGTPRDKRRDKADRSQDGRAARSKAERAVDTAVAHPLTLVAGGVALGAVVGALLPRSERERQLLAPIGTRLSTGAVAAFAAAKNAGKAELDEAGISRDNARDQVRGLLDTLVRAASKAGSAAVDAAGKTAR